MEIIKIPLEQLTPDPHNAKDHPHWQIEQIVNSIEQFGNLDPIGVWGEDNLIVEGHGRYEALKELGYTEAECIRLDWLTEEERTAYALAHNKLTMNSGFIPDALDMTLAAIGEIDMSQFGFEIPEEVEPTEITEDEVPENAETRCKLGDLWQLGQHRLICGDSTDVAVIDRLMDGVKADMVFTSPPYNGNNTSSDGDVFNKKKSKKLYGDGYSDNLESSDYIKFCKIVLGICFDVTDGFIFWNVNYNANSRFEYIAQIQDKLEYLNEQIAWIKTSAIPLKGTMRRAWEPIYLFSTNRQSPKYDGIETNKWDVSNTNSQMSDHKACFPVELVAKGIKIVKPKSGVVFDPFGGSGSTLIACEQLNRKCYMAELDPHYCDVIIQRWENLTEGKAVRINDAG